MNIYYVIEVLIFGRIGVWAFNMGYLPPLMIAAIFLLIGLILSIKEITNERNQFYLKRAML